ncbi:hypothetical protein GC173_08825 [bacterium]|nr:hypothetical protein [bacterium]
MDAAFFLFRRTGFIRRYYRVGVEPFRKIQRQIDAQECPYDEPPPSYDPEYGEPEFHEEWIEADEAAQVVGRSAVSILSDSLKLYFKALEQQLEFRLSRDGKATATKGGFLKAYRGAIGEVLETDWANCPVRFDVIEQIVLARNRAQHGEHLSIMVARHAPRHSRSIVTSFSRLKESSKCGWMRVLTLPLGLLPGSRSQRRASARQLRRLRRSRLGLMRGSRMSWRAAMVRKERISDSQFAAGQMTSEGSLNRHSSPSSFQPVRHDQRRHTVQRPVGIPRQIQPLRQLDLRHEQEDRRGHFPPPFSRAGVALAFFLVTPLHGAASVADAVAICPSCSQLPDVRCAVVYGENR